MFCMRLRGKRAQTQAPCVIYFDNEQHTICNASQQKVPYVCQIYFEILSKIACKNIKKIVRKMCHLFVIFSKVTVQF